MKLEIDLERLVDELATLVAERLGERFGSPEPSPAGTFRKWVAEGRIPSHGGRRRLFHRAELDAALGYVPPETRPAPTPIRRTDVA